MARYELLNNVLFFVDEAQTEVETINVNIINIDHLLSKIEEAISQKVSFSVATLNLDHIVKLRQNELFYSSYRSHTFVTADGWPIVGLGRLAGVRISRTTGSDMVEPVVKLLSRLGKSIAILGSDKVAVERAVDVLRARYPAVHVSYTNSPPFGFDPLSGDADRILREIAQSGAAVCLIALGAPKQEIFAARAMKIAPEISCISVGAAIDFLANRQVRAPQWMQQFYLEWLWRLFMNPRRLFWRYVKCAIVFPIFLSKTLRGRLSKGVGKRSRFAN